MRLSDLADRWLAQAQRSDKSANTLRIYRIAVTHYANPTLGGLRLRKVGTPAIDGAIRHVVDTAGPGAARTMRSVLSGMSGLAVRYGTISANPAATGPPSAPNAGSCAP